MFKSIKVDWRVVIKVVINAVFRSLPNYLGPLFIVFLCGLVIRVL